jgi:hypothetical protein
MEQFAHPSEEERERFRLESERKMSKEPKSLLTLFQLFTSGRHRTFPNQKWGVFAFTELGEKYWKNLSDDELEIYIKKHKDLRVAYENDLEKMRRRKGERVENY